MRPRMGAVAAAAICLVACGDYSISLPNNYALTSVYSGNVLIHSQKEHVVVINAAVDAYQVSGQFVIGHVSEAEQSPDKELSKPGYFILNTATGDVRQGLGKDEWLRQLPATGVSGEPSLHAPSRFDRNY